jgi:hypothetical protein
MVARLGDTAETNWDSASGEIQQMASNQENRGLAMILAGDGKIEAVSQPAEGGTPERFSVGTRIFEYFDASSAEALRDCMMLSAEQGAPNVCWPVCTSTSQEVVIYQVQVVSFGGAIEKDRKFAVYWQRAEHSGPDGSVESPIRPPQRLGRGANAVIHDLNNLLTTIISFTGFLKEDLDASDPRREDVCEVLEAAQEAGRLTSQLTTNDPDEG